VHISLAGDKHMRVTWITYDKSAPSIVEYGTSSGKYSSVAQGESTSYSYLLYRSGKIHHTVIGPLEHGTFTFINVEDKVLSFSSRPLQLNFQLLLPWLEIWDKLDGQNLSYADYMQSRWDTFGELVQPLASARPWMVTQGNHEKENIPLLKDGFASYNSRWKMPYEESGSSVHAIMLGSYTDYDEYSDQYRWLKADLSKVDRQKTPWLVALFHVPWYNSNKAHQGEGDSMMAAMEPLLYAASVDIVLAGHVHAYERTYKFGAFKTCESGKSDTCGAVHITIGDGGNREGLAHKYINPSPEWSVFREASFGHGELKIVNSTHAFWTWHRNDDDEPVRSDQVWITSLVSSGCVAEKRHELRICLSGYTFRIEGLDHTQLWLKVPGPIGY
ncbi:purple acid phosphatase 18, partial [Prunus dulcis]